MILIVVHVHVDIYNRNSSCETGNICQAWDISRLIGIMWWGTVLFHM